MCTRSHIGIHHVVVTHMMSPWRIESPLHSRMSCHVFRSDQPSISQWVRMSFNPMFHGMSPHSDTTGSQDVSHSHPSSHFLLRCESIRITSSPILTLISCHSSLDDTHVTSHRRHISSHWIPCNISLETHKCHRESLIDPFTHIHFVPILSPHWLHHVDVHVTCLSHCDSFVTCLTPWTHVRSRMCHLVTHDVTVVLNCDTSSAHVFTLDRTLSAHVCVTTCDTDTSHDVTSVTSHSIHGRKGVTPFESMREWTIFLGPFRPHRGPIRASLRLLL